MHHGTVAKGFTGPPRVLRERWPVVALALVAFFLALTVKATVFPLYSGDNDEPVYVFQARMLLHGDVTLPADEHGEFFRPWLTGERDGRLFTQYQPGWPAVLAASQKVFGSIRFGPPLAAAGLVVAVYALALETTRKERTARIAALVATVSPIFVLHSGLYLSYVFATMLVVAMAACALHGERVGTKRWLVAAGALFGTCVLTRPFDAVLFAAPLVVAVTIRHRHRLRSAIGRVGVAGLGATPFLVLAAAYNRVVTGSMLTFAMAAADPLDTFGFGPRRMLPDQAPIDYSPLVALKALGQNLLATPEWLLGAWVGLAVALWAATRRSERAARTLLVALAAAFPLGYFFWWATAFAGTGARNGLGPHYYLPAFVPLAILLAWGLDDLFARRRRWHLALVATAVVTSALVLPAKLESNLAVTENFESIKGAIPDGMQNSVVFVRPGDTGTNYLLTPWPFLENGPQLDDPVLYAIDRGARNEELLDKLPNRDPYRLRQEVQPGQGLDAKGRLDKVEVRKTERLELHLRITNPTWKPFATGFIKLGDQVKVVPLLRFGNEPTYEATFFVDPPGAPAPAEALANRTVTFDGTTELAAGVSFSDGQNYGAAEVFERRFPISLHPATETTPAQLAIQSPGTGWHLVDFGNGPIWLLENVDAVIRES